MPKDNLFFLREFFCPQCATLLEVEVVYQDDPPLHDEIFRWLAPNGFVVEQAKNS
jgi:acetone carboxylase gamma subunit